MVTQTNGKMLYTIL